MEALQRLREHVSTIETTVVVDGEDLVFQDEEKNEQCRFHRGIKTAYKSKGGTGDFYNLHALWFFLKSGMHKEAKYGDYRRECRSLKIMDVNVRDQKDMKNYLTGISNESQNVKPDELVLEGETEPGRSSKKRAADEVKEGTAEEADEARAKKRKKASKVDAGLETKEAPVVVDTDLDTMRSIASQERILRDHNSVLNVKGRLEIFDKASDAKKAAKEKSAIDKSGKTTGKYSRVLKILEGIVHRDHQDKARREKEAKEQSKRAAQLNPREEHWMANRERELQKAANKKSEKDKGTNFDAESFALEMNNAKVSSLLKPSGRDKAPKPAPRAANYTVPEPKPAVKKQAPIIIVPQGRTALVNMFNAKQFLQDGQFQSKATGAKKNMEVVDRRNGKHNVRFEVVDNVKNFKPADWKRVVAVFVQGPEWQFKDWKKYKEFQTVPDILSKVCGFHIMYEDEMVDQKVKQWRCKVLKLSKHKRHLDGPASSLFWQIL